MRLNCAVKELIMFDIWHSTAIDTCRARLARLAALLSDMPEERIPEAF
ncbi:MAG: hypothetical protein ACOX2T_04395 [bacterium]